MKEYNVNTFKVANTTYVDQHRRGQYGLCIDYGGELGHQLGEWHLKKQKHV
jgi:hypothetical protein